VIIGIGRDTGQSHVMKRKGETSHPPNRRNDDVDKEGRGVHSVHIPGKGE